MLFFYKKRKSDQWRTIFHPSPLVLLVSSLVLLSGCVATEMASDFSNTLRGDSYLDSNTSTAKGIDYFQAEVAEDPENAVNNYYLGRLFLRKTQARKALEYLKKAGEYEPKNSDYQFWIGVAHGMLNQWKQERSSYLRAVRLDSENQQALTALGHAYLRRKQYRNALKIYSATLSLWPENPAALYNRALVLTKLRKRKEAKDGWRRYLQIYDTGGLAESAVDHLNQLGDFSYRNYPIGARTVTVKAIRFESPSSSALERDAHRGIEKIGRVAAAQPAGTLQIVVYDKGDKELARQRALVVKNLMLEKVPELEDDRIGVSWFGKPYRNHKNKWRLDESVDFFLVMKGIK